MRSSQNEVFEYDQASTNRKLCSARGSLSFLSVWPWWPGSATGVQTSHNSFSEIVSSGGIFTLLTHPLCYIKPHKLSRGKNSLRRVNSTCMSVMELVWCGQVIEASCSRYRSTACIPLITKMQWVCACTVHTFICECCMWGCVCVITVDCRMGFAGRDSLLVFFTGAHQTHASTWQSCFIDLKEPQSCSKL